MHHWREVGASEVWHRIMNLSLLNAFIAEQRKAKQIVADWLNFIENITAQQWSDRYTEIISKYEVQPFADVFTSHGFGLELMIGDFYIDYDYSRSGRQDGLNAWHIFVYLIAGK